MGINPARADAIERYQRDEEFARTEHNRAALRRRQIPSAKFLEVVNVAVVLAYRSITENDSTFVVEAWNAAGRLAGWFVRAVVGLVISVWLGPTLPREHAGRKLCCAGCSFRKADQMGIFRCTAASRCVCPRVYWWKPAFLSSQVWFRGFECPIGRFRANVSYLDVLAALGAVALFLLTII
jgi:hypothetical protein